jgi:hypothetical protein
MRSKAKERNSRRKTEQTVTMPDSKSALPSFSGGGAGRKQRDGKLSKRIPRTRPLHRAPAKVTFSFPQFLFEIPSPMDSRWS